jgi:O-antigen ligase
MTAELARMGGPLGAAALAALILVPGRLARLGALLGVGVGALLLAVYLAPSGHEAELVAGAVAVLMLGVSAAALFLRWPWLVVLSGLACVPARIPVTVGNEDASLLLPLYLVVLGAGLAVAWQLLRGDERFRELGPLAWPLAALVAWTGLSLAWTEDLRQGAISLLAFYLPFGLLAVVLARLPWSRRWLTATYALLAAMALVFSAIGVYQWVTRDVFWNPKVIVGNAYLPFYRVNSVFWDPSIYGRFLVVSILASLAIVLYMATRDVFIAGTALIVAAWIGLYFSFSQSSFAALGVGVLVAAAFAWGWRVALAATLAVAVVGALLLATAPARREVLGTSGSGINRITSGRSKLVGQGARIALHHPVVGVGIGGFKRAFAERTGLKGKEPKKAASHNTPVTVAAETGIPGLLLLGWLFVVALLTAWRRATRTFDGTAALAFGLIVVAIGVHSLFYNAFFEDPVVWAMFGLIPLAATALAAAPDRAASAAVPSPAPPPQPPAPVRQPEPVE